MNNIIRNWNNRTIRIRDDRYVSLTDMAQATGKLFGHWNRLESTKSYLETLSRSINMSIDQLVQIQVAGKNEDRGTWAHPEVAKEFERWCYQPEIKKSTKFFESSIRDSLAIQLKGKTEVPCKTGFVDILTNQEVIEVKAIKHWKAAIGQALVYACEFPAKKPRVHLFGETSTEMKQMIVSFCSKLNVAVSFED